MADPYIGEIRLIAANFAPVGWSFCDGSLLSIASNSALFALIGTTYGGDGQNTFGLPDLRGRVPLHFGTGAGLGTYVLGQSGGVENVTLTTAQMPTHSHTFVADNGGATTGSPSNGYFADSSPQTLFSVPNVSNDPSSPNPDPPAFRSFNAAVLQSQGGNQPHSNLQPYVALNYIIALFGIFPSQN